MCTLYRRRSGIFGRLLLVDRNNAKMKNTHFLYDNMKKRRFFCRLVS